MPSALSLLRPLIERPRVLMVTHVVPYPPGAGNEIRIYKLLKWLSREGWGITLILKPLGDVELTNESVIGLRDVVDDLHVFDNRVVPGWADIHDPTVRQQVDTDLQDSQLSSIQDGFCPAWFVEEVARIARVSNPRVVIAEYVFMSRVLMLPEFNQALRIIDAHDIFSNKEAAINQYGIKNYPLNLTKAQERKLLERSEVVLAIQRAEQNEMIRLLPERKVILASFDVNIHEADFARMVPNRVLIVASGNEFNVRGAQDFLDYIWPLIREINPAAHLHVVGRICSQVSSDDATVSLLGFVENLEGQYEEAAVVVNPCRVGTGLKIKTIEALAWGKAHVAWPSGVDGLHELGDVPVMVATNVVDFADAVSELLHNPLKREEIEKRAHRFMREYFSVEQVYGQLKIEIDSFRSTKNRVAGCLVAELRLFLRQ